MLGVFTGLLSGFIQGALSRVPKPLPRTDAGVLELAETVCRLAGVPFNPSTQQAVAMMAQGLLRDNYKVSVHRMVIEMKRAQANQALFNAIQDARAQQAAEKEARENQAIEQSSGNQ